MDQVKQLEHIRRQQVSDYRSSGKTAAVWCAENNMKVSTLRYWLNKFKNEAKADNAVQEIFIEFKQTDTYK